MSIILKSAKVINVESKHNGSKQDILISEGKIKKIGSLISDKNAKIINIKNLHVSTGWFDSSVSFGEPGFEERETLLNGADVASKSGFTDLLLNSCTKPVLDNQTDISFIKIDDKNYLFDGKTPLIDLYKILNIDGETFETAKGESDTIAGFCIEQAGKILLKNEKIIFGNFTFTVEAADKRRIKKIKIKVD